MEGENIVSIFGGILILMVVAFFFSCIACIYMIVSEFNDFIEYMKNAFLDLFSKIENAIINFFDVLYQDIIDLFDEILEDMPW